MHNSKQNQNYYCDYNCKYTGGWYKIFINDRNTNECLGRLCISSDETENHL